MKYVARTPRDDVNVSKEHPLVEAGTLVFGLGLLFATVVVVLILLVDLVLYFVPAEREVALFSSWLPEDIVTIGVDDPRLATVEQLSERLAQHWPDTTYTFRVEVDDNDVANAFALPGGLIVVTTGLLDEVESENELAFVLAHELGHFRHRDHIRGLGRGVAIGILVTAVSGGKLGDGLGATIAGAALTSFSRRQEQAADEFALELVQREYGHVADAWRFFARRRDRQSDLLSGIAGYMSTHPAPYDRIEHLKKTAAENAWTLTGETRPIGWATP